MLSMHSSRIRCADPSKDYGSATRHGATRTRGSLTTRLAALALIVGTAAILPACSSGSGGDNGAETPRDEIRPTGLNFTYPFNGQSDVVLDSTMIVNFAGDVSGDVSDAFELQVDGQTAQPSLTAVKDDNQSNIIRLTPASDLLPNTRYRVVATRSISDGATSFEDGDTLFRFETRPLEGRPAADDFAVTMVTPGETNFATGDESVFTQFNAIRVILNEPVDSSTVTADSFTVTGPNGPVTDAKVTALGRYIVFDPNDDLAPGDYTVSWTNAITSVFGDTLEPGSEPRTVLDIGDQSTDQTLIIEDDTTSNDVTNLDDNILGGMAVNNVNILSQLIGSNDQPVIGPEDVSFESPPIRNRIATTLATPGEPGFDDVFPAVIRAGQIFQLTGLTLELGGEIATPIAPSGPIDVNFINDVSVYLMGNDYRNIETPTAVQLRFDLGIGTLITSSLASDQENFVIQQLANGVFNQSVLNIQAAGLAIPRDNGDLEISTLGTFPLNVNRTDNATVDFQLTLVLPADPADAEGGSGTADNIAPIVTAQSPSACLYVFGSPAYDQTYAARDAAPTALPEPFCQQILAGEAGAGGRPVPPFIDSFPIEASPAITFSSPLDPSTINDQSIQLTANGSTVSATYRAEGFSVVIDPDEPLDADTMHTITLNASQPLRDLTGNALTGDNTAGPGLTINFTTEPQVEASPAPVLLGTLTPGIPCALEGGDFQTGGNQAGNCIGSSQEDAPFDYPVFTSPADVPIDAVFSKFVQTESVVLADGCLTAGNGAMNTRQGASVALQEMDGGQCVGTPPAELAFANIGDDRTRSFTIRPIGALQGGTRYWIVVCGDGNDQCTSGNSGTITDIDNLALNTTPLNSTGSTPTSPGAAGGPDIVMPFDTVAVNDDYYTNQFTLPETDTNGNGQYDDINGDEIFQGGEERPQPGNRALVGLSLSGSPIESANREDGKFVSYLALARPIAIGASTDQCDRVDEVSFDDNTSAIGDTAESCIPVALLPGGFNSLTGIGINLGETVGGLGGITGALDDALVDGTPLGNIPLVGGILGGVFGGVQDALDRINARISEFVGDLPIPINADPINTGRIMLRFPNDDSENATTPTQTGYIVEKCQGTFPNGVAYDFEPCFAASLTLVANAPDGQGVALDQQSFEANIVGPVTFEQNGRLVISVRNANTITLDATALGLLPATATIEPADLNFQLVGNATHGGRAFPNR